MPRKDYLLTFLKFSLIFSFLAIIFSVLYQGPILSPDTYQYIQWSDLLISQSFNLFTFYSLNEFWTPSYFYTTVILLLSILKSIFPESWEIFFLILNLSSIFTILWCFYSLRKKLTILVWPLALAPLLFLIGDALIWPAYILTDTYFAALVILAFTTIIKKETSNLYLPLFILLTLLTLTRPTSPAVIIGLILMFIILRTETYNLIYTYFKTVFFSVVFLSSLFFSFLIGHTEISNEQVNIFRSMAFAGEVIRDRPETWLDPSERFLDLIILFLVRFISFFQIWVSDFSPIHNLLNSIFLTFFSLCSLFFIFAKNIFINKQFLKYQIALFLVILVGALFHSGTLIDYDWRYRFAYVAPMALFSVITFEQMVLYFSSKRS